MIEKRKDNVSEFIKSFSKEELIKDLEVLKKRKQALLGGFDEDIKNHKDEKYKKILVEKKLRMIDELDHYIVTMEK